MNQLLFIFGIIRIIVVATIMYNNIYTTLSTFTAQKRVNEDPVSSQEEYFL